MGLSLVSIEREHREDLLTAPIPVEVEEQMPREMVEVLPSDEVPVGKDNAKTTTEVEGRVFVLTAHLGSFKGGSTLKTWIFRITINHCRDRLSRWRPVTRPIEEEVAENDGHFADPGRGPEELAVAADEGRRVAEGLSRLPHSFREAVILRDIEGLSYEEIAEVLQCRVGTVRSRIARGREQLRTLLEKPI